MSDDTHPTGEFLLYTTDDGQSRVECRFENETLWLSQALMAELFDRDVRTVNEHLQNLFEEDELAPEATIRKFRIVRSEGARQVARVIEHYNLEAILAADYQRSTKETTSFFKTIQNKFHFAATGETAAERFRERADASRPNMGLAVWKARWCTKSTSPWPNEQQSALPGMP